LTSALGTERELELPVELLDLVKGDLALPLFFLFLGERLPLDELTPEGFVTDQHVEGICDARA
jgi:hypothetical protein